MLINNFIFLRKCTACYESVVFSIITILKDVPNPLQVIRYHSLAAKSDILPQELKISCTSDDGTIMGVRHKEYPVEGLQFHPESIRMKPHGMKILKNFLNL